MNDAQRFRAQAELCLRIARLMKDRAAADQLNAKAADYLAQAVELETNPAGAGTAAVSFVALAFVRMSERSLWCGEAPISRHSEMRS